MLRRTMLEYLLHNGVTVSVLHCAVPKTYFLKSPCNSNYSTTHLKTKSNYCKTDRKRLSVREDEGSSPGELTLQILFGSILAIF